MDLKQVTAIVRTDILEAVECRLRHAGVPGITVTRVKGCGEYANFFAPDWKSAHTRIDVFTDDVLVQRIVDSITQAARTGTAGDGIVSVLPIEKLYRIRDHRELHSVHGPSTMSGDTHAAA